MVLLHYQVTQLHLKYFKVDFKKIFYLFLEREEKRGRKRGRKKVNVWLPLVRP